MDELDEEDYWGTSKVKSSIKKKDIFSDLVTVDDASSLAKFGADSDLECITWDDEPVTRRERAASQPKQPPVPDPATSTVFKAHNRSRSDVHSTKGADATQVSSNRTGFGIDVNFLSLASDSSLGQRESVDQDNQHMQYLQDRLRTAEDSIGAVKIKVEDTIQRMVNGFSFNLEQYKSKEEKLDLLDRAIRTHDGNAIIAVVIFLKRTLSEQIFYYELTRRPDAVNQYISLLKAHFSTKELEYMLEKLNRAEEVAMLRYKQAASVEDPETKINRLEQCLRAHFDQNPNLDQNAAMIRQQISLLKRQRPLDEGDLMIEQQGHHMVFRALPRTGPIINASLISTLLYCCIYHYDEKENIPSSPVSIKKDHQLNEKQLVWTALRARAKLKKWTDIDDLFTTKGWLGGTKMRSVIGFEKVASVLFHFEAQSTILCKYLMLVDDVDKRLQLAVKMNSHKAVIETYAAQRDRRSLEAYHSKLRQNSEEWFFCKDMLGNSSIKWKS